MAKSKNENRTVASISREDFVAKAQPIAVKVGDNVLTAEVKQFATGSYGWYLNGKATIVIDGKPVSAQAGMNLIVVGSKDTK